MINNDKKIIIASGGTGGHIFPAVGLANYLNKLGFNSTLTTDKRGLKFIDRQHQKITKVIKGSSFNNKKFTSFFKILYAVIESFIFLIKIKPKLVFGMGGYASFPICFACIFLRIPLIIYESNLAIGKVNRYLSPFAKKIFVSYEDVEGINKNYVDKILVVGNILRESILHYPKSSKNETDNILNILVLGGSQAAKIFAEILPDIFIKCKKKNINIMVYQQCLNDQKLDLQNKYKRNEINHELFSFTFDILRYYNLSNLVISRSGSSALGEFLNCQIPFISIPLATSSENHQLKNAKYFMKKGLGFMIEEKNIQNELFDLLQSIHKDKSMLESIKANQNMYSDKDVYKKIKKEVTKLLYEN